VRIKWSEQAKRLAHKYDLSEDDVEIRMEQRKVTGVEEIGIKTYDGKTIWFSLDEDNMIQAEVKLR
jgi:hypothetical protein